MSRRQQICCLERDRFLSYRQLHSCYILTWRTEKALVSLLHLKDTNKCHHGCSTLMTSFKPNDFSFTLLNIITLKVRVKSANPFLINLSWPWGCRSQLSSAPLQISAGIRLSSQVLLGMVMPSVEDLYNCMLSDDLQANFKSKLFLMALPKDGRNGGREKRCLENAFLSL